MKFSDHVIRIFLIFLGSVSVILGVIGLLLPVMPTVPFLIFASFCFVRSSEKFYIWLIHHKILGKYIKAYVEEHSVTKLTKLYGVVSVWFSLSITIYFIPYIALKILLVFIGLAISIYILRLNTLKT